jgi:hypothetical protein
LLAGVAPAAHVAGRDAVEQGGDPSDQLAGPVEEQSAPGTRLLGAAERLQYPRLGLRSDAGRGPQSPGGRGLAQLLGRTDPERPRDLDRALGAQPEIAAEADELGGQLALELLELGYPARLDQLEQPRLDARTDPAQLANATRPDQLRDWDRRAANRLGGAPVGPRGVGIRVGQLEQGRERVEAPGQLAVVVS